MNTDGCERTVRVGGVQYRDPRGVWRYGLHGTIVRVHPDSLEQFDRANVDPPHVPEPEPPALESWFEPADPEPAADISTDA